MFSTPFTRRAVFTLFFASGATGLIYEVVWTRLLSQSFGNTVFAISTVLAVFMAGLGAGGWFFGKWIDRRREYLAIYGVLEIGIGLAAVAVPLLLRLIDPPISSFAASVEASFLGQSLLRLATAFLLLFPPTFLMGGTLPVLSKLSLRQRATVGWDVGALYGINTLGAMAGAFLAGFVLIKAWGLQHTTLVAAVANLLIGGIALILHHRFSPQPDAKEEPTKEAPTTPASAPLYEPRIVTVALIAYALSGFAALGAEVVWSRALVFFLGNSTYAFSTLLTTFLGALALGSLVGSKVADRLADPLKGLILLEAVLTLTILVTIPLLWKSLHTAAFRELLSDPSLPWTAYLAIKFVTAGAVLFLPALLFGMAFPLVCRITIARLETAGRGVGLVYALNTAGAILGSLLIGFVLIPAIGLQKSLVGVSWVTATASLALLTFHGRLGPRWRLGAVAAAVLLVGFSVAAFPLQRTLRGSNQSDDDTVLYYAEDHTATVLVYRKPSGEKYVSVDGHFIGATEHESDKKQRLLGHLPALLAANPETALTIGLGSGITLGALTAHPGFKLIEAIEIVPSMLTAARYFEEEHGSAMSDPRARVFVGDGINYVKTTRQEFDVISSDAKLNPEYVGNALVYSEEYYRWSRDRLTENGVFVQWVPLYLPPSIFRTVVRTFCTVFPSADLWFFPQQHSVLVGRKSSEPYDFNALTKHLDFAEVARQLQRFGLADPYTLASSHIADRQQLLRYAGEGPINTWDHPLIEFESVRAFRQAPRGLVEEENLRQLLSMLRDGRPPFSNFDEEAMATYVESFRLVLRGLLKSKRTDLLTYGRGEFEAALERNPNEGRARDLLRLVEVESRLAEGVTPQLTDRGAGSLRLARLLYADGKFTEAERAARAAVRRRPTSAEAHNLLGLVLQKLGKGNQALAAFQKALDLDEDNVQIRLNLATAFENQGRLEEALDVFLKTLRLEPDSPELHNNLGIVYAKLGRHSEAVAEYRKAIQLDPEYADALNNLGIALGMQGQHSEAIDAFQQALRLNPAHTDALKNVGITYLQIEKFSQAATALEQVVQRRPDDVDALTNLGLAYAQTGRFREARECWEKALLLQPGLNEARQNLQILRKMGY